MSNIELAKKQQIADVRSLLDKSKAQIAAALPRHLTPERMIRIAMTAIQRTPKLMECSHGSLIGAVITASQLGIEPDGVLGRGYLIPRKNKKTNTMEANFMAGYLGLIELAMRSDKVSWIASELVYACDKFEIRYGLDRSLIHVPDIDSPDRGVFDPKTSDLVGLRGAYAVVRYKDGETDFEYMPIAKLHRLRNFSQSKDSDYSPWNTELGIEDMYRKCPVRKLAKRCPLSPEFQKAAQLDELVEAGISQDLTAEIDPASETARIAMHNRADAIAGKYLKPEEAGESQEVAQEEHDQREPEQEAPLPELRKVAQARANESGEPFTFTYQGMSITIDPEPTTNPHSAQEDQPQHLAPKDQPAATGTSHRPRKRETVTQPTLQTEVQGLPGVFEKRGGE